MSANRVLPIQALCGLTNVAADGRSGVVRLIGMKVESPAAELGR